MKPKIHENNLYLITLEAEYKQESMYVVADSHSSLLKIFEQSDGKIKRIEKICEHNEIIIISQTLNIKNGKAVACEHDNCVSNEVCFYCYDCGKFTARHPFN